MTIWIIEHNELYPGSDRGDRITTLADYVFFPSEQAAREFLAAQNLPTHAEVARRLGVSGLDAEPARNSRFDTVSWYEVVQLEPGEKADPAG